MQAAIDRVMHTYSMIANLTIQEEEIARENVTTFLAQLTIADEHQLAIEGLRYLRRVKSQ